jgi:uncharacterized protein with HEPN domain
VSSKPWLGNSLEQRARDILDSIRAIRAFVADLDEGTFSMDRKTRSAVECELLRISEAAAKIRDMQTKSGIAQPERIETRYTRWSAICAIGNRLRHEYGRVDDHIIWQTVRETSDLPDLESAIRAYFQL